MALGKFGTAINCMDGRVQLPVIEWMKNKFDLDYVDMITEPGPDRILAEGTTGQKNTVREKADVSVTKHGSKVIVVTGHDDCAGNPVAKEEHIEHIKQAMRTIKSWNFPVQIVGIWIDIDWNVKVVDEID